MRTAAEMFALFRTKPKSQPRESEQYQMSKHKEQLGPDAQTALANSGTNVKDPNDLGDNPTAQAIAENAITQFIEWQKRTMDALGIPHLFQNVRSDNPVLLASLAKIRDAGAPSYELKTEHIVYPGTPSFAFDVDVYEFGAQPGRPLPGGGPKVRATEYLLASYPDIVIQELRTAGVIA